MSKKKKNPSCKSPLLFFVSQSSAPSTSNNVVNFCIFLEFLYGDISKHKHKLSFSCMLSASIHIDRGVRLAQHKTIPCSAGTHLCRAGGGRSFHPSRFVRLSWGQHVTVWPPHVALRSSMVQRSGTAHDAPCAADCPHFSDSVTCPGTERTAFT